MEASRLASSEASAAAVTAPRRALATLVSTSSGVILAAMSRVLHHRLEAVVGGHRGQRGVVGQGDGTVHGRRGAVVGQLQVHAVRGALSGHHALQHVEGRLVCLVSELCSAAMLPSVVARAAAVARGAIAGARSSFEASSAASAATTSTTTAAPWPRMTC